MFIYPPNTIAIAIDLPVDAPPRAVRAAAAVLAPVPPLAILNTPVVPVDKGSPVALVNTIYEGVPIFGVTKTGLVENTILPVPVSSEIIDANWAEVVELNWLKLPDLIELTASCCICRPITLILPVLPAALTAE